MTESHEALSPLREPFPPAAVGKLPKGGAQLDYVGHAAVTDRLLSTDLTWNWEPLALDDHGLPQYDAKGGLWIKLTVCGITRLGYGDGPDPKQRIGDAIRNAAMRFGVALDLWSKSELESSLPVGTDTFTMPRGFPQPPADTIYNVSPSQTDDFTAGEIVAINNRKPPSISQQINSRGFAWLDRDGNPRHNPEPTNDFMPVPIRDPDLTELAAARRFLQETIEKLPEAERSPCSLKILKTYGPPSKLGIDDVLAATNVALLWPRTEGNDGRLGV